MILYKRILSFLLLSIYVLTSAHDTIPHNHDSTHDHKEHSHDHHHNHHGQDGNHLIQVSHGIFHSVVHFIEHLGHHHDCSEECIVVEITNSNHHAYGVTFFSSLSEPLIEYSPKSSDTEIVCCYSKLHLLNSSLRGPPSIV